MATTLKDIAQKLDLSVSTVSYALNGGPKPVSISVKKRVDKVARELGYAPNRLARSLVTRRTHTIGVVPIDVAKDILLKPIVHSALNGIFNAAAEFQQDVLVFTAHDRNLPHAVGNDLLDGRIDGVVFITPRPDSPALLQISKSGLPFAVVEEDSCAPNYCVDNAVGVELIMNHLWTLGHRRIAHVVGDLAISDARARLEGYRSFMNSKSMNIPSNFVFQGSYWRESGFAAGLHFAKLTPRPTAVFCANDSMAFGLIEAFHRKGIRCPQDVSVVGFDDARDAADFHPPLTTASQPIQEMATEALLAVISQIETGEKLPSKVFFPNLVVRGSTAPLTEETIQ